MAASLRSVGFDLIEVMDATLKQKRAATRQFADKLEVSDVGLVYYSGHESPRGDSVWITCNGCTNHDLPSSGL